MKKEHIMQNAPSGRHRLIHASVASALALISISVQANTQQFAQTPFYLQNKTDVSGQPKVKHNIMFLIDDSGSMLADAKGEYRVDDKNRKINIAKSALKQVWRNIKISLTGVYRLYTIILGIGNGMRQQGKRIMLFTHMQNCLALTIPKAI